MFVPVEDSIRDTEDDGASPLNVLDAQKQKPLKRLHDQLNTSV